jgi:hypothetical protein
MKKSTVTLIVEIIGAIGVIASLIYLSIQIKQSNKVAKAEITKDLYLASRQVIMELASNDNLSEIWADVKEFDDEEWAKKYAFFQSFFRLYELQHILNEQGLLEENMAISYSLIVQMFAGTKDFPQYWSMAQKEFNPDFVNYVTEQIALSPSLKDSIK